MTAVGRGRRRRGSLNRRRSCGLSQLDGSAQQAGTLENFAVRLAECRDDRVDGGEQPILKLREFGFARRLEEELREGLDGEAEQTLILRAQLHGAANELNKLHEQGLVAVRRGENGDIQHDVRGIALVALSHLFK